MMAAHAMTDLELSLHAGSLLYPSTIIDLPGHLLKVPELTKS